MSCLSTGEPEPSGEFAGVCGVHFDGQESFQHRGVGQLLGDGFVEDAWECFSARIKFQCGEMTAQRLIQRRLLGGEGPGDVVVGWVGHVSVFLDWAAAT
jgi:hypothetical protein